MYYWVRESWQLHDTIVGTPELDDEEIDFLSGSSIRKRFSRPLVFEITYEPGSKPHHYFDYGTCIPVVSKLFLQALKKSGIDNFQAFPAILRNSDKKAEWSDYFAFNVIGMVNATDLENSEYGEIMSGNDEGVPSLGSFTVLALKKDKLHGLDMFREPVGGNLVVSERVLDSISAASPEEGFGIIADEIILT